MNEAGSDASGPGGLSRRKALTVFGVGAAALIAEQALVADGIPAGSSTPNGTPANLAPVPDGYAPDGTAGRMAALPLNAVQLLGSPFLDNESRLCTPPARGGTPAGAPWRRSVWPGSS